MEQTQAQISVIEYPECVRLRKEMYIYSKEHMIYEIIDNSIDEASAGHATAIAVAIQGDTVIVEDNGRGIPVTLYPDQNKFPCLTQVEVAMITLHAGGKMGKAEGYQTATGGLHGVGASCVNALSEEFTVRIKTGGKKYQLDCSRGVITENLRVIEENIDLDDTGTEVTFKFDEEIWKGAEFDYKKVQRRIKQLAYLNPGLLFLFIVDDGEIKIEEQYCYEQGLNAYIEKLNHNKKPVSDIIGTGGYLNCDEDLIAVSMQYVDSYDENIIAFCNNVANPDGGDHITGFKTALTKAINEYAIENKEIKEDEKFDAQDVREGIVAVVSIKVKDPKFIGQAKTKIEMPNVRNSVKQITEQLIHDYLDKNPDKAKLVMKKCQEAKKAREAAKRARELSRTKAQAESTQLPGKLAECMSKKPEECEIFLVEGDSAGGSAKQGRNRKIQAVLPLKGKILNVEKQRLDKVLKAEQIQTMISAFRCGIGDTFNIDKIRYHKIIMATDADIDGFHIQMLEITFFYRYLREVIEKGYLYAACPPLYKITEGKGSKEVIKYAYSDDERDRIVAECSTKPDIQRYKGLGEMNAEELYETTMNPETRTLYKITIEDAEMAEDIITIAMGEDVDPRKEYILENAQYASLDI